MTANVRTNHLELNRKGMAATSPPAAVIPFGSKCLNAATKFGDDDLASKRRKVMQQQQIANIAGNNGDDDGDDYNIVFTKKLNDSQLNGTFNADINYGSSGPSSLDFNGGPVIDSTAEIDSGQRSISSLPSDTSFGFHNTFSVLQRQMQLSKQPKLSQQQIEYLLHENNVAAVQNPIYVDIPISDESYHRAISGAANGSFDDANDQPNLFELELEATQRVKQLLHGGDGSAAAYEANDAAAIDDVDCGMKRMPAQICASNPSLLEDFYQQDGGDYSDYVYHVARSKNGQVYLRVVRSLLVDKGNSQIIMRVFQSPVFVFSLL